MESTPNGLKDTYSLTLSSHPGKALVLKDKVDHFGGHDVNWFTVGEESKALEVTLKYNKDGHCFIRYKRHGEKEGHAFDCAMGKFHEGNKVPGYDNHKGGNQCFVVNQDKTISPTHSPKMTLGIKDDDLVLVKNSDFKNRLVFDKLEPSFNLETLKVMALKPSSHKGIGIVIKDEVTQYGHGMNQYLEIGDQSEAISVFIDQNDHMLWSESPSLAFDGYQHEDGKRKYLFTSHVEYNHQQVTVNDDGTISLKHNPEYVLGISEDQKNVILVKKGKGTTNQFIFDNAKKILGVEDKYAQDAIKKAQEDEQRNKLKEPFKLKNGIELRYSQEIGGDKSTNNEIFEWPSNEYLDNLSQEQLENFSISSIQWVKGTHFGPQEDFCNSLRFESNHGEQSPLFAEKEPNEAIDVSKRRIAKICGKTNYHHAFCYKLFDDFGKVIEKPIYSKYDEKKEDETSIEIGLDEKLVGFRIQLSDWVDCKISKIWFKIAKCKHSGIDYDQIEKHTKEIEAQKKKLQEASLKLLQESNLATSYQVWDIEKHNGEKFIQHCNADGTYKAYRQGSNDEVDRGDWKVEGTTYMEKGGDWKGEITMKGEKDFFVDFYAGEHGYHKYTAVFEPYENGISKAQQETLKNVKTDKEGQWFCIHYADFCGGDASSEHCESFEQAVQLVMKKPKKSNIAYQFWKAHQKLYTKPTGKGAYWTNEHTNNHPEDGHLFVFGKSLNVELNGRTLIRMDNVDTGGGPSDGHIDHDIQSDQIALQKVISYNNSKVAYFWCNQSNRLIEKSPDKRAGKWNDQSGVWFACVDKVLGNGEKLSLQDIANDPKSFVLQLSGHNDHPSCNGEYSYSGEKHNDRYKWTHSNGESKLVWTGRAWDISWGGYSPEAPIDTPVPPESGYTIDQGGCDIKVQYRLDKIFLYQRIKLTQFDQVFGIVCAQEWEDSQGQTFSFLNNGKASSISKDFALTELTWILNPESKIMINTDDGSNEYELVWKQGKMALENEDQEKNLTSKTEK